MIKEEYNKGFEAFLLFATGRGHRDHNGNEYPHNE